MKRLRSIEFVAGRRWPPLALGALVVAALVLAWQAWLAVDESSLLAAEQQGMRRLSRPASTAASVMSATERQRHADIEALARHVAAPWKTWLTAFESHAHDHATLTQLELDAESGTLNVTARAADLDAMMQYVLALQSDSRLQAVQLQSHDLLPNEPGTPVQFRVTAQAGTGAARRVGAAASAAPAAAASGSAP